MFTGMLESVADVHQLTIILGHEMAHALLGHSVSTEASAPSSSQRHLHVIHCDPRADFGSQVILIFKDSVPAGIRMDDLESQHTQTQQQRV